MTTMTAPAIGRTPLVGMDGRAMKPGAGDGASVGGIEGGGMHVTPAFNTDPVLKQLQGDLGIEPRPVRDLAAERFGGKERTLTSDKFEQKLNQSVGETISNVVRDCLDESGVRKNLSEHEQVMVQFAKKMAAMEGQNLNSNNLPNASNLDLSRLTGEELKALRTHLWTHQRLMEAAMGVKKRKPEQGRWQKFLDTMRSLSIKIGGDNIGWRQDQQLPHYDQVSGQTRVRLERWLPTDTQRFRRAFQEVYSGTADKWAADKLGEGMAAFLRRKHDDQKVRLMNTNIALRYLNAHLMGTSIRDPRVNEMPDEVLEQYKIVGQLPEFRGKSDLHSRRQMEIMAGRNAVWITAENLCRQSVLTYQESRGMGGAELRTYKSEVVDKVIKKGANTKEETSRSNAEKEFNAADLVYIEAKSHYESEKINYEEVLSRLTKLDTQIATATKAWSSANKVDPKSPDSLAKWKKLNDLTDEQAHLSKERGSMKGKMDEKERIMKAKEELRKKTEKTFKEYGKADNPEVQKFYNAATELWDIVREPAPGETVSDNNKSVLLERISRGVMPFVDDPEMGMDFNFNSLKVMFGLSGENFANKGVLKGKGSIKTPFEDGAFGVNNLDFYKLLLKHFEINDIDVRLLTDALGTAKPDPNNATLRDANERLTEALVDADPASLMRLANVTWRSLMISATNGVRSGHYGMKVGAYYDQGLRPSI